MISLAIQRAIVVQNKYIIKKIFCVSVHNSFLNLNVDEKIRRECGNLFRSTIKYFFIIYGNVEVIKDAYIILFVTLSQLLVFPNDLNGIWLRIITK